MANIDSPVGVSHTHPGIRTRILTYPSNVDVMETRRCVRSRTKTVRTRVLCDLYIIYVCIICMGMYNMYAACVILEYLLYVWNSRVGTLGKLKLGVVTDSWKCEPRVYFIIRFDGAYSRMVFMDQSLKFMRTNVLMLNRNRYCQTRGEVEPRSSGNFFVAFLYFIFFVRFVLSWGGCVSCCLSYWMGWNRK